MSQQFLFKYNGSEPGYCRTDFKRRTTLTNGTIGSAYYCILIPDGLHTSTPGWGEPCSPIAIKLLPVCKFERIPEDDSTAEECNAWIEQHTGGFIGDIKVGDWVTIPSGLGGAFDGRVTSINDETVYIKIKTDKALGDYSGKPWAAPLSKTVHAEKLK